MRAAAPALVLCGAAAAGAAVVPTVTLRNGVKLPMVSAGSWQYNSSTTEAAYRSALGAGFAAFDTAYGYYNQDGAGRALASVPRSSLFVETKVPGCGMLGLPTDPSGCAAGTTAMLEENLRNLSMTYADLVLLHSPPEAAFVERTCKLTCDQVRAQWGAVQAHYAAGGARAVGVSNYCASCMECLDWGTGDGAGVLPMVNQVMVHVGMGTNAGLFGPKGIKSFADAHGVVVQAYSPLGGPIPKTAHAQILSGNLTTAIARAHNVSAAQVALKFIVRQGIPVVTKAANPAYLREDIDLWSWDVTDAEMAQLTGAPAPAGIASFACTF